MCALSHLYRSRSESHHKRGSAVLVMRKCKVKSQDARLADWILSIIVNYMSVGEKQENMMLISYLEAYQRHNFWGNSLVVSIKIKNANTFHSQVQFYPTETFIWHKAMHVCLCLICIFKKFNVIVFKIEKKGRTLPKGTGIY